MISILSIIVIILGYGIRQKVAFVYKLENKRRLSSLAEVGIYKAIDFLKRQPPLGYLGLNSKFINNPVDFKDIDFGQDLISFAYSFWDDASQDFITYYGFLDEARKLNINTVDISTLRRFFILLGLDEIMSDEIASSIIDWRDSDSLLSSPNSAEDTYYRFLEPAYEAKDDSFEFLEELIMVKGINKQIFLRAKDYLTVYGDGKININTASKIVLMALGIPAVLADKIISFRAGKDGISGTEDDCLFVNTNEIVLFLEQAVGLTQLENEQLKNIQDYLTVDSEFFTIKVSAYPKNDNTKISITAVVNKEGKVFFWQES